MRVAKSSQCQGSAACIIVMTSPPEPSGRFIFKRIVNNPQEKCACWARATRFAMHLSCTATTRRPGHIRNSCLERPQNLETKFNLFPDGILAKDSFVKRSLVSCARTVLGGGRSATLPLTTQSQGRPTKDASNDDAARSKVGKIRTQE